MCCLEAWVGPLADSPAGLVSKLDSPSSGPADSPASGPAQGPWRPQASLGGASLPGNLAGGPVSSTGPPARRRSRDSGARWPCSQEPGAQEVPERPQECSYLSPS